MVMVAKSNNDTVIWYCDDLNDDHIDNYDNCNGNIGEIKSVAPSDVEIYSDLAGHMINNSVIPQDILVSNGFGSKPDLVVISRSNKRIALFELTCPLERNIHTANTYNTRGK